MTKENYEHCLNNSETISCQNSDFRFISKAMQTYTKDKIGLSPVYVKGVVTNDGNHIHPLIM